MNDTIKSFPKIRIELPKKYQEIYADHYKLNRDGDTSATSLAQKMEAWLHKKVAKDLTSNDKSTLEIGAGTLNQLAYEETQPYDIIEPFTSLYTNSKHLDKIRNIYKDIDEINLDTKYDRITSIATFEHVLDLPKVVAKSCLLLNNGGSLRVSIPNEGTILWKLGYKLTTGIEFKMKYGLDYELLMRYEHVNTSKEIEQVLKYFFKTVKSSSFGISKGLAFYRFNECATPDITKAQEYLMSIQNI